ncbi:MAG: prolyl oligopeptidase family serine peptidase [Clostridia bacterium]|nr:prolyl oligopeptidase family serine peptidase [Clostridia bacterium]
MMKNDDFHGFKSEIFEFDGQSAELVFPDKRAEESLLILKTEYWNAFPETELELLRRGHHLAFIKNINRWGTKEDIDRKAGFIKFLTEEYNLCSCVPVGMSCGGIFAVKLAALYPELISCIYLDAPVVNYMSCPCGFGNGNSLNADNSEIMSALSLGSIGELMAYRDMPLDYLPRLTENKIPALLVAGDSDKTVPYDENGLFIERAYKNAGVDISVHIKPGCDHHPHGLPEPSYAADIIEKFAFMFSDLK